MFKNSFSIGRIRGIEIRLDYSWFIIFSMFILMLAIDYYPKTYPHWPHLIVWLTAILTSALFFCSVLAHELSHSFVAKATGSRVKDITLFIFGGAAQIKQEPNQPAKEFWMALVGPLTSIVIGLTFLLVLKPLLRQREPLAALSLWLGRINIVLAVFNLIPGFPLDGGRVLRALLWHFNRDFVKSTRIATNVGRTVSYVFIFIGVFQVLGGNLGGLWIAFIGWFLNNAAAVSYRQVAINDALKGYTAGEIMETDCTSVPENLKLDEFVHGYLLHSGRRCFPVLSEGRLRGLITVHGPKKVPRENWSQSTVAEVMIPFEKLVRGNKDDDLSRTLRHLSEKNINQIVITDGGRFEGILSREHLIGFIKTRAELGL